MSDKTTGGNMDGTVWIVGKYIEGGPWEVQGIFTDEQQALAACIGDNWFVGPIELNKASPVEAVPWVGLYYPRLQDKPGAVVVE